MAHLFRVVVPVGDIAAAAAFYGGVLGSDGHRISPGRHYFDCEGAILACYEPTADGDAYTATPNPEPIYLAVSDLPAVYEACCSSGAELAEGSPPDVGPLGEIAKRPWGERSALLLADTVASTG